MNVRDMFDISGEKALVTGAAQGLGEHMALALAEAGADVAVVDINVDGALKVAETIQNLGRESVAIKTDVTKIEDVETMVEKTKRSGRMS